MSRHLDAVIALIDEAIEPAPKVPQAGPSQLCPSLFLCHHLANPCEGCNRRA